MGVIQIRDLENIRRIHNPEQLWEKINEQGLINGKINVGNYEEVNGAWRNEPCFIICGSYGLKGLYLNLIRPYHSIAVNHTI